MDSRDVAGDSVEAGEAVEGDEASDDDVAGDSGEAGDEVVDKEVMSQCSAPEPVSLSTKLTMPEPTSELTPQELALRKVSQALRPFGRLIV